jgi:hypothetical protein
VIENSVRWHGSNGGGLPAGPSFSNWSSTMKSRADNTFISQIDCATGGGGIGEAKITLRITRW